MTTRMARRLGQRSIARQVRNVGFMSADYRAAFGKNPEAPNKAPYQKATLEYLEKFDCQSWFKDPVQTVINGEIVQGGTQVPTVDAFFRENGAMIHGDSEVLAKLKAHLASIDTSVHDYRTQARAIEDRFTSTEFGPELIANQSLDFMKQDGFTEIEEWVQACTVERNLNDALLGDEMAGTITIGREPSFVGCVSNFSNFLDLSRKTLRSIELGIPVVVLSRSNTTQHMYRWFLRLISLMKEHGIPTSMATYASLDVPSQRDLISSSVGSPMYFTGSRDVAAKLKEVCPKLFSSTVGPNTMVITEPMNEKVYDAIRISSTIENAGQCTHVRHLVAPQVTLDEVAKVYDNVNLIDSTVDAIKNGFRPDGMLKGHPTTVTSTDGYTAHKTAPAAFRVGTEFPPDTIQEKWREAFLDVTSAASPEQVKSKEFLDGLAKWLVRNGPITLAVNGDMDVAKHLFEKTSMTNYTIGTLDKPGLTVSARPQENEAFGEFPARPTLTQYTKFPVLVPSSTPSYNSQYTETYLAQKAVKPLPTDLLNKVRDAATNASTKGFITTIYTFLVDACGPRPNTVHRHARTAVTGWQRPPLDGSLSVLRVEKDTSLDALLVHMTPFIATNAAPCLHISCNPANAKCAEFVKSLQGVSVAIEENFDASALETAPYNVQNPEYDGQPATGGAPVLGPFLALFFPLGHVKCLNTNDTKFVEYWVGSEKWLRTV
eukprot:TRINITY_DN1077_c1_g1_i1.p1 TRINITY_DN1077_c1_g1~~TRINITY_DN1077_c1_g1_i1.p1  ORF type:complete len:730 (+),score=305.28 TRINITY_DN1077_c1_g1_i1:48-2192(+)